MHQELRSTVGQTTHQAHHGTGTEIRGQSDGSRESRGGELGETGGSRENLSAVSTAHATLSNRNLRQGSRLDNAFCGSVKILALVYRITGRNAWRATRWTNVVHQIRPRAAGALKRQENV